MKQTKKGFTLVELLVVIAILAILATVSVVGYTTFIEKANRSVDEQAVAQINTALMAANIPEGSITNIAQVQALMDECNLEIEDYKPLSKDKFFFYDSKLNRVIYTNNTDYQVLYPQELADKTDRANWFSLSGEIHTLVFDQNLINTSTGVADVTTAEQLYTIAQNIGNISSNTITLNIKNDINMMGAHLEFNVGSKTFKLIGEDGGVVISNIAQTDKNLESSLNNAGESVKYGGGLVSAGKNAVLSFKNITIANSVFGTKTQSSVGAFVGNADHAVAFEFEDCAVINCDITADYRAAAFVGRYTSATTVTFTGNCRVEGTTITTQRGIGAYLVGMTSQRDDVAGATNVSISNTNIVIATSNIYDGGVDNKTGAPRYDVAQMGRTDILYFWTNAETSTGAQSQPKA